MLIDETYRYHVAVIGAGPAGLFAARELAARGVHTVILNRDIKPGGLAEYGIYPTKLRMKEGLRNQFRQILAQEDIEYYGNVLVGELADLSLSDLRSMGFQALLVTVGAQSAKRVGIPGEDLREVYHAKDLVYHYNLLPPFSETDYPIGKRVAVIGVGNVMLDIAHWLIDDQGVDEVIAIARRGPAEVKFDRKELENVIGYLDRPALETELARIAPVMQSAGQTPEEFRAILAAAERKAAPVTQDTAFRFRFFSSPVQILGDAARHVTGLKVEENELAVGPEGESRPRGTGQLDVLDVDTVIFAIGDVVDSTFGLPVEHGEFAKDPEPRFPIEGISYEAYDPQKGAPLLDTFLAGWARRPSAGLVGLARKDATNAAHAVYEYLQLTPPTAEPVAERLREQLMHVDHPVVDKQAWQRLDALERERALALDVDAYKFATNRQMLEVLGLVPAREKQESGLP